MAHETHERHEIELMPKSLLRYLPFLFSLACVLSLGARTAHAANGEPRTIVFFGDSLTAGYGLDNPGTDAYPALIQKNIDAKNLPWRVVNAGLSGETSSGGLRRVDWILRQPVDVFVLALGANDGLRGISPELTRRNLQQIIDRVRSKYPEAKIVVAGMQMPPALGDDYVRAFQAMFPAVARENDAALVPFLLEGVGGQPKLNLDDQIHPNPAGHRVVASTVWNVLRTLL